MKLSMIFLPALATIAIAGLVRVDIKETILTPSADGPDDPDCPGLPPIPGNPDDPGDECCNQVPCFIACPVGGKLRVSLCFNDQT